MLLARIVSPGAPRHCLLPSYTANTLSCADCATSGAEKRQLGQVQQLARLTLATDEAALAAAALAPGAPLPAGYDLVAVQPLSERVLQQVRTSTTVSPGLCLHACASAGLDTHVKRTVVTTVSPRMSPSRSVGTIGVHVTGCGLGNLRPGAAAAVPAAAGRARRGSQARRGAGALLRARAARRGLPAQPVRQCRW